MNREYVEQVKRENVGQKSYPINADVCNLRQRFGRRHVLKYLQCFYKILFSLQSAIALLISKPYITLHYAMSQFPSIQFQPEDCVTAYYICV
jgi:hypothetical protein